MSLLCNKRWRRSEAGDAKIQGWQNRVRHLPTLGMPTETFSDFVELLEKNGELARVKTRVSPVLEVAEIADRMSKTPAPHGNNELDRNPAARLGGKALLFENVEGSDIPLAINTVGSYWAAGPALLS